MTIYQSQQNLENKSLFFGLLMAFLLYTGFFCGYYYLLFSKKDTPILNITTIDLDMFEIGGGLNDATPTPDIAPTPPIEEVKEEIVEEEKVDEVVEEEKEVVEPEITEEIIKQEEIKEIVEAEVNENIFEEIPKAKPKPNKKVEEKSIHKESTQKPVKKPKQTSTTNSGGLNAYNPNANKIASSAINNQNTIQNLTASEKNSISSQIQAIIAKEAIKNYPRTATLRRQEGITTISFTYSPNGVVSNIIIKQSSGHKILDDTVINVINKVKTKFPPINVQTNFTIPIKFSIK